MSNLSIGSRSQSVSEHDSRQPRNLKDIQLDQPGNEITGRIEEITITRDGYIPQRWTNYLIRPGVFHNGPIEMTPTHKGQPGQVYETDYGPQPKIRDDQPSPIIQKDSCLQSLPLVPLTPEPQSKETPR